MCEFCTKHGEGEKWYLQVKNYSDDLLSDVRRRKFIEEFNAGPEGIAGEARRGMQKMARLDRAPWFIRTMVSRMVSRRMKKVHFGQVVPVEDVEKIFAFVNSIVRLPCVCRKLTVGEERRYCYGISLEPDGGRLGQVYRSLEKIAPTRPDTSAFETVSREDAIAAFRAHEKEGLCHSVWTVYTPFIGGICNCDRTDCLAMQATVTHAVPVMFRAEYVAHVHADDCSGCRECMRSCQFGALTYSASTKKVAIDQRWCYGCGVCRSACRHDAIHLEERAKSPVAAAFW